MYKILVKESLQNFERKKDPLSSLNIGKRKLIEDWLAKYDITDYVINDDLTVDSGDECSEIYFANEDIGQFPDYIQFNKTESFVCYNCKLTSLRGCPKNVYGYFDCDQNSLENLDGCPLFIEDYFSCQDNYPKKFTKEDVLEYCNVKMGNIYV